MTQKFTPGPWAAYIEDAPNQGSTLAGDRYARHLIQAVGGETIVEADMSVANARLIALAPEMLGILLEVSMYARINHVKPQDYLELVKPIIDRARGAE